MPVQPRPLLIAAGALSEVHVLVESVQAHPCDPRACQEFESRAGAIAVTHLLPRACPSTTELVKNPFGPETVEFWAAQVRNVSSHSQDGGHRRISKISHRLAILSGLRLATRYCFSSNCGRHCRDDVRSQGQQEYFVLRRWCDRQFL